MFYEIAGRNFDLSGKVTTEDILKDIIESDQLSQEKIEMTDATRYYASANDILQTDYREFYVDSIKYIDYNKSNERLVNNLFKKLIDQKQGYMVGKPLTIKSDNKELKELVDELLGKKFYKTISEWAKNASIKGKEALQPFITKDGDFDYCLIPAEQMIYLTDTTYQKNVEQAIRYYVMEFVEDGDIKRRKRVEVWDNEKVTRYQEVDDGFGDTYYQFIYPGTYGVEINPQYHWYTYNTNFTDKSQLVDFNDADAVGVDGHGWGRVPVVNLSNNAENRSDLVPIRSYIDALDVVSSGFINDLRDIQLAIWVLRGYEGEGLDEFMFNLQKFKAINLGSDGDAGAEPKTLDIPKEARSTMMEWLERKIYEVGQGVDEQKLSGGSITNVVIKAMYAGLDIKANQMIVEMQSALEDFMYFVVEFINDRDNTTYDYRDLKFEFNLSTIFNRKEIIEGLMMLAGTLSKRTILELLPYDIDVDAEFERIEQETMDDSYGNPIPKPQNGETQEVFISRCVSVLVNEGMENEQAVEICNVQWGD